MELVLQKQVQVGAKIDSLDNIIVTDKITYHQLDDGVKAVGVIDISADLVIGIEKQKLNCAIDVDLFAPALIVGPERFFIKIDKCEQQLQDDVINFQVLLTINGLETVDPTFDYQNPESEDVIIIDQEIDGPQIIDNLKNIQEQNETAVAEVIAPITPENCSEVVEEADNEVEIAANKSISSPEEQIVITPTQLSIAKPANIEDGEEIIIEAKSEPAVVDKEEIAPVIIQQEINQAVTKIPLIAETEVVTNKEKEETTLERMEKKNNPFDHIPTIRGNMWKFHACQKEENYQSIALLYNIDEQELARLNNHKSLTIGTLVKLP